jgi:hypothetical protein
LISPTFFFVPEFGMALLPCRSFARSIVARLREKQSPVTEKDELTLNGHELRRMRAMFGWSGARGRAVRRPSHTLRSDLPGRGTTDQGVSGRQ